MSKGVFTMFHIPNTNKAGGVADKARLVLSKSARVIKQRLRFVILIVCIAVFAVSAVMLVSYYAQGASEEKAFKELADFVGNETVLPETPAADASDSTGNASAHVLEQYRQLHEQNTDMAGWITIDGTSIDYPVMYTPGDGDFYLSHGFDKATSKSGVPFIDWRCAIDPFGANTIIYGHHMKNGTMFAKLECYKDENFFLEHPAIRFDTLWKQQGYEIIAVFESQIYKTSEEVFKHYNFSYADSELNFNTYIANIKELSLYDTGVTAAYGDELLTLVTCDYDMKNGQLVVVAKKQK